MFMKLPPLQYPSLLLRSFRFVDVAVCHGQQMALFVTCHSPTIIVDINPVQLLLLTSRAMGAIMAIVLRRELWRIDFSIPFD